MLSTKADSLLKLRNSSITEKNQSESKTSCEDEHTNTGKHCTIISLINYLHIALEMTGRKRKRCGECDGCTLSDCGVCKFCLDMAKFGGTGKRKQCCAKRRCVNLNVKVTICIYI